MSLAPRPTIASSSTRAGRFPCAGTVSVWPASRTSGLPVALRVEQRLAVREDQLERHRLLDVGGDGGLVPRLGRDVDQLERALGEQGIGVGTGHNRSR